MPYNLNFAIEHSVSWKIDWTYLVIIVGAREVYVVL